MKNFIIKQHQKTPSESVERLLNALSVPPVDTLVFNYGKAVLKTDQYAYFAANNIPSPEFTVDIEVARQWLSNGAIVVCRGRLRSQAGGGITLATSPEELVESKVYTKYIPKKREFRVNVFKNRVINIREKVALRSGVTNTKIRTPSNGYHTTHLRAPAPAGIEQLALLAANVSDSDFKGVDIGYNQLRNYLFVLEVNSGPSIEGTSVTEYANVIRQELS